MSNNDNGVKQYSGWWLVLVGAVVAVVGVAVLVGLSLGHIVVEGSRAVGLLLLVVPIGVAVAIIGLVHVIRHKPVIDDSAKHAEFERRNRELMRQQKEERRAGRRNKDRHNKREDS